MIRITPTSQHAVQMWVNRHLFPATAGLSTARPQPAAIFILITTPIITRDYSNISEHTHTHTRCSDEGIVLHMFFGVFLRGWDLYVFSLSVKSLEKASLERTKESLHK